VISIYKEGVVIKSGTSCGLLGVWFSVVLTCSLAITGVAGAQTHTKPNILVIFGDDIGQTNISAYSRGLMGFTTPNIDRIEGQQAVLRLVQFDTHAHLHAPQVRVEGQDGVGHPG
jgi:hypothetical protein